METELLGPPLKKKRIEFICHRCNEPILVKTAWIGRGQPRFLCRAYKKRTRHFKNYLCHVNFDQFDEETLIQELSRSIVFSFDDRIKMEVAAKK